MLGQMQQRFGEMNTNIVQRIDEMGRKIDELETSISELVQEAQVDPAAQNNNEGQIQHWFDSC